MQSTKSKREKGPQGSSGRAPKSYVVNPAGGVLTVEDLPSARPGRWVARKKAEVVAGVRGGLISLTEACARYELTPEEFLSWQNALDRFGLKGLGVTKNPGRARPPAEPAAASSADAAAIRAQSLVGWP